MIEKLFRNLAGFHYLDVPIGGNFYKKWDDGLRIYFETFGGAQEIKNGKLLELLDADEEFRPHSKFLKDFLVQTFD